MQQDPYFGGFDVEKSFNNFSEALETSNPTTKDTPESVQNIRKNFSSAKKGGEMNDVLSEINKLGGSGSQYTYGQPAMTPEKASFEQINYNTGELYGELSNGENIKKFDTYTPGIDNNEWHAQNQSTFDKWKNGATKALAQFTTGVIGGTVGGVHGILNGIKEGSLSATYDNDFLNWLDLQDEKLRYAMPNFKTKEEQNMSFVEGLGTANFWADDVLGGIAFTASAIATELVWSYATGGTGSAIAAQRIALRGAKLFGKAADKATDIAKIGAKVNKVEDLVKIGAKAKAMSVKPLADMTRNSLLNMRGAITAGKIGQGANVLRSTYTGAGYEAGFEARSYMREMRENFEQEWITANGVPPTEAEKEQFEENLKNTANGLFAYNLAIVGSSNIAQFGSLVGLKMPSVFGNSEKYFNRKIFGSGVKLVDNAPQAIKANRLQKIGQYAYSLGKGTVIEGAWEEGMQSVGKNTAQNIMQQGYDQKFANESYELTKAFGQAMNKTYNTEEGLKEVYTGMIIGGLTGNAIGVYQNKTLNHEFAKTNNRAKMIEENFGKNATYSSKVAIENMLMSNRVLASKKAEENANRDGDWLGGNIARSNTMFAQFQRASALDYFDETIDSNIQQIDLLDEQTLMKENGITLEQAKQLKDSMKEEYQVQAESFKRVSEFSNYFIGNKINKQEKAEIEKHLENKGYSAEEAKKVSSDVLRQALTYELYAGEVAHKHSDEMLQAFQNNLQNVMGSSRIRKAFSINDVLNKSTESTKRKFRDTKKNLEKTLNDFDTIEKKYRELENILNTKTTPEGRQAVVSQLSELQLKRDELNEKKTNLQNEINVLYNSAKMENPFGENKTEEFIPTEDILSIENDINTVLKTIEEYKKTNPQKAEVMSKLLREYEKSVGAFKTYSKRTSQIIEGNVGLRGRQNIFSELFKDKTPKQSTIDMIKGLLDTHYTAKDTLTSVIDELTQEVAQPIQPTQTANGVDMVKTEENTNQEEIKALEKEIEELQKNKNPQPTPNKQLTEQEKIEKKKEIINFYDIKIEEKNNGFHLTRNGSSISIFNTQLEAEQALEKRLNSLVDNLITTPIDLGDNVSIDGISVDGNTFSVLNTSQRMITIVDIGGVKVPFYLTTGLGGKNLTPSWYPMFGYSASGWLNKTNGTDMEAFYERLIGKNSSQVLKDVAEKLNVQFGTQPNSIEQTGILTGKQTEEAVNSTLSFTPAENQKIDPTVNAKEELEKLESNIQSIGTLLNKIAPPINTDIENKIKEYKIKIQALKRNNPVSNEEYIIEQIKKHPYLFSQVGEEYESALPTENEIGEYYALATQEDLSEEEAQRLEELNTKMANWQLLEAVDGGGVTIAEMILQDIQNNEEITETEEDVFSEEDLAKVIENGEPEATSGQRPLNILQTIKNVFIKRKDKNTWNISHLTPKGFFNLIGQTGQLKYYYTKKNKKGETVIDGNVLTATVDNINDFVKVGMVIDFGNTQIKITNGNKLEVKDSDLDPTVFRKRPTKSGYSILFDGEGKAMTSDFQDVDTISDEEIYNLSEKERLVMKIDMNDPYNEALQGQDDETIERNVKISLYRENGTKVGELKAQYESDQAEDSFQKIRQAAAVAFKESNEDVIDLGSVEHSYVFLGAPNLKLDENNKEEQFEINPEKIVTYGYWSGSSLTLKEKLKVKTDLLKGIDKKIPVVVIKQGNFLVAYPVTLNKIPSQKGDTIMNSGASEAQIAIEFNKVLKQEGKKPSGLFYLSPDNQNFYNEDGTLTDKFNESLERVNNIPAKNQNWLDKEHKKEQLKEEATINIDLEFRALLSPKIVISTDSFEEFKLDVITEEQATTMVNDFINKKKALPIKRKRSSGNFLYKKGLEHFFIENNPFGEGFITFVSDDTGYSREHREWSANPTQETLDNLLKKKAARVKIQDEKLFPISKIEEVELMEKEINSNPKLKQKFEEVTNLSRSKQNTADNNKKC